MSSPITPLGDRVVATRAETKSQTKSGLFLPDQAKEKPVVAVVQSVGKDVKHVKIGDTILYKEYSVTEVSVEGTEYLIVKEEDVLGTVTG